jgi:prepilin-type N-terminal cleavage/methylation domain-containing protein
VLKQEPTWPSGGFTLLETILALAIASILLAGVAPLLSRASNRAREQETVAELRAIKDGIAGNPELGVPGFIATMGRLPGSLEELVIQSTPAGRGQGGVPMGWVGPYLTIGTPDPLKDGWGRPYVLELIPSCGAGSGWRLRSLGPDGSKSADDDLVIPPQGCFLSSGTLQLEILRDAGGALSTPEGRLAVALYYRDPFTGAESSVPGTATGNVVSFLCRELDCQIPLGMHAVSVQLDRATTVFWRNVALAAAVNSATLAFPFPPPRPP